MVEPAGSGQPADGRPQQRGCSMARLYFQPVVVRLEAEQDMKVHFDEKANAVYVRLDDSPIVDSEEVHPGIVLDFNDANQVVGIEILRVKDQAGVKTCGARS